MKPKACFNVLATADKLMIDHVESQVHFLYFSYLLVTLDIILHYCSSLVAVTDDDF